ncbi:MAG: hypothetical protein RLZZ600_210 [Actinomycetota bacterium]
MIKSIIAGSFGLFFAWNVWAGIGNFLGIQNQRLQLGLDLTVLGWFVILLDVFAPILLFVAAILVGRKLSRWAFAGVLLLALLLVAVINLDLVLGVPVSAMFATGAAS